MRAGVLALTSAAVLGATAAAAPHLSVTLGKPATLRADTGWEATLTVRRGGRPISAASPRLAFRNGLSRRVAYPASTSRRGRYRARVSLPVPGSWSVAAAVRGRTFRLAPIRVLAARPVASILPTAQAFPLCGGEESPLPQYAAALDGESLWIACRSASELRRIDTASGETRAVLAAPGTPPYSISAGGGAVWAATRSSVVTSIDTTSGRAGQLTIDGDSPYLWFAAGSLWVADDARSVLVRIDPATRRTEAEIRVGNGAAGFVTDGQRAWVVNHRDATLDRIDLATNAVTRLGTLPGEAPERMTLSSGSLWITGRGTDLLRVDPQTGAVRAIIEIGAGATDVAAASGRIWVTAASDADDRSGLPVLERLLAVDPATNRIVETVVPTRRLVVDGTASDGRNLWLADLVGGRLYRVTRG